MHAEEYTKYFTVPLIAKHWRQVQKASGNLLTLPPNHLFLVVQVN